MKIIVATLLLSTLSLHLAGQQPEKARVKDRVKSVKTVTGTLVGFEIGDYQHVTIRTLNGKRLSFFIAKPGLDYFLAVNKSQRAILTYQVVDSFVPENGGVMTLERLVSAKVGNQSFEEWWQQLNRKYSADEIEKRYGPLVRKYQLN